jgi:hypothetical protein
MLRPALLIGLVTLVATPGLAQSLPPRAALDVPSASEGLAQPPQPTASPALPGTPERTPSLFEQVAQDYTAFWSVDTLRVVGMLGASAAMSHRWDREIGANRHHLPEGVFGFGATGGSFLMQTAAGVGTYVAGKASGSRKTSAIGTDLLRAQLLSQGLVQGAKLATHRSRPDGSNQHSLPSGHTASAFATATVLHRHLGWKVGVPATAFAAYIGASRLSANRHYLSDVLLGAGIGIAAARTVTMSVGRQSFAMSVGPTPGGAAVLFTRR